MEKHVLVNNQDLEGKFVALTSFIDKTVVASGDDPEEVMQLARETISEPVLVFIPDPKQLRIG